MTQEIFDVAVIGAGPGGSSTASFLARDGVNVLLLDKSNFPRDKICGDFLSPKAFAMLEKLGCINDVLDSCNGYVSEGDMFVNGEYLLTGTFPKTIQYPDFGVMLERKVFDNIILNKAIDSGAHFRPKCLVKELRIDTDGVVISGLQEGIKTQYKAKMVIGADGVNSVVSKAIGNSKKGNTIALSLRAYFEDLSVDRSKVQIYFDKDFFPGYGWVFADDDGFANVGVGYVYDNNYPAKESLKKVFNNFVKKYVSDNLKGKKEAINLGAGRGCFSPLQKTVSDRVILIGDAANMTDPINGGGIHIAMENGELASYVALQALTSGDFSADFLGNYNRILDYHSGIDRLTGDFILTLAKNPHLREIYLASLNVISEMVKNNEDFRNLCGGIFTGVSPTSSCFSPMTILQAIPMDSGYWSGMLDKFSENGLEKLANGAAAGIKNFAAVSGRMITSPVSTVQWSAELLSKSVELGAYSLGLMRR